MRDISWHLDIAFAIAPCLVNALTDQPQDWRLPIRSLMAKAIQWPFRTVHSEYCDPQKLLPLKNTVLSACVGPIIDAITKAEARNADTFAHDLFAGAALT